MARTVEVKLVGDDRSLRRAFGQSSSAAGKWSGRLKSAAKAGGLALAAGVGVAVVALKKSVDAAKESELAESRLRTQLKASGESWRAHKDRINDSIDALSNLSALDDEAVSDSLTNILRVTGDVNKALKLNALAADIARAKGMDMAKAGELVGKVAGGNLGILSRYGIVLKDNATKQEALATLQKKFGGQAEAYGKSTAGAQERFNVALENVMETVGAKLLPVLTRLFNWGTQFMAWAETNWPRFQQVAGQAFDILREKAQTAMAWFNANVLPTIQAIVAGARKFWARFGDDVKRNFAAVVSIIRTSLNVVKGIIEFVLAVLRGDWSAAWQALKDIARNAMQGLLTFLRNIVGNFARVAKAIGTALKNGIVGGLRGVGEGITGIVRAALNALISLVNSAIGKVNSAIGFANKLPGPDIPSIPTIPQVATGGHVARSGLAVIHKGETVVPARVSANGGGGRFLVLTDAEGVAFLQGLDRSYRRGNGGRGIFG